MATQAWLSEPEQRQAIETLERQHAAGHLSDRQLQKFMAAVWRSNTQHELYRRTGGRLGRRATTTPRDWRRVVLLYVAVALGMLLFTWLTAMAAADGLFGGS